MKQKFNPKNLNECNMIDWCQECSFGDDSLSPEICENRREFLKIEISKIKTNSKDNKYIAYMWFNVRTIKQLKEAMSLLSDDTKIDIDLRMVENLAKKVKELQFREPKEPRDININ